MNLVTSPFLNATRSAPGRVRAGRTRLKTAASRARPPILMLVLLLSALILQTLAPLAGTAEAAGERLLVSDRTNLSDARPLQDAELEGDVFMFLSRRRGVRAVRFHIDDPQRARRPFMVDRSRPYELVAGKPFDTSELDDGRHTLTAEVLLREGKPRIIHATFEVSNQPSSPAPEPTPAPEPPPGETGIAFGTYDVLLRPGGYGQVQQSTDRGRTWSGEARLQAVVDGDVPGTKYKLAGGLYRGLTMIPKANMHFMGAEGGDAVVSGARDISHGKADWQRDGERWYINGQTQEGFWPLRWQEGTTPVGGSKNRYPGEPQQAWEMHAEELYVTKPGDATPRRLLHVESPGKVRPGKWHFDYAADRIYIGENPADVGLIETSVATGFLGGKGADQRGVVVENLSVQMYASVDQAGAIGFWKHENLPDLTVRYSTIRHNHGTGAKFASNGTLENSEVYGNGVIGASMKGGKQVIRRNRIHHNATYPAAIGFAAAGMKSFASGEGAGSVAEQNWVHDNGSNGLWWDVGNNDLVVRSNLVERQGRHGIFYEISNGPVKIYWNTVRDNDQRGEYGPAGVFISNSANAEVYGNAIDESNANPVYLRDDSNRPQPESRDVTGAHVHDNDIRLGGNVFVGLRLDGAHKSSTAPFESRGNRFIDNTYRLANPNDRVFHWKGGQRTFGEWQNFGQDRGGRIMDAQEAPKLPLGAVAFHKSQYGPLP